MLKFNPFFSIKSVREGIKERGISFKIRLSFSQQKITYLF
jgi:hypothetical protein